LPHEVAIVARHQGPIDASGAIARPNASGLNPVIVPNAPNDQNDSTALTVRISRIVVPALSDHASTGHRARRVIAPSGLSVNVLSAPTDRPVPSEIAPSVAHARLATVLIEVHVRLVIDPTEARVLTAIGPRAVRSTLPEAVQMTVEPARMANAASKATGRRLAAIGPRAPLIRAAAASKAAQKDDPKLALSARPRYPENGVTVGTHPAASVRWRRRPPRASVCPR
jgi:hypothetical protein